MKLYWAPRKASLAVLIVACELEQRLTLERVDLEARRLADGRMLAAVNSRDMLPVLELDDGRILTETSAILLYLASHRPGQLIAPRNSFDYFRTLEWLSFCASELHKPFVQVRWDVPGLRDVLTARLVERFAMIEREMTGAHLVGDRLSIADIYLYMMALTLPLIGCDVAQFPKVSRLTARIDERPAVQRARLLHV